MKKTIKITVISHWLLALLVAPFAIGQELGDSAPARVVFVDATDSELELDEFDPLESLLDLSLEELTQTRVSAPALNQVVTTVSRQESTVGKTPAAVFVVTQEMIRRSGARTLPEVLRVVPGLHVARIDANKWAISIRGFNSRYANKLLVQIDGRVVYTPLFGGTYWDAQDVMLEDVERIEVVRGPGATVWGANAVNGVINILTKHSRDTTGALVAAGGGKEERAFASGRVGGQVSDELSWRAYGKYADRDNGFTGPLSTFPSLPPLPGRVSDDSRQGRGGFRMDWTPTCSDEVTFQGDFYNGTVDPTLLGKRREVEGVRRDGTKFPMELTVCEASLRDHIVFTGFVRDLTAIKEAETQLQSMNDQLVETSRRAGMAEVANNVLHNVGNVLNSVNVAAALLGENIRKSEVRDLNRVLELVSQHRDTLDEFLTNDPRGKHLPGYLIEAGRTLSVEQETSLEKLEALTKNIDHIKNIVATQQSYAGMSGVEQVVELDDLFDDALNINIGSLERHHITVLKEYDDLPPVSLDKQKVMQILINLIGNSKHAIRDGDSDHGEVQLRLKYKDPWVELSVEDNGVGITRENLERIFRHGFTTKKDGHGFGLHSAVLAAKEMGGSLTVTSEGVNTGATFTLKLPLQLQKISA